MGTRRQSRECALQILFQWDIHGSTNHWLEAFWAHHPADPQVKAFAEKLTQGVMDHRAELDTMISTHATNWKLTRMPVVDRNILRAALFELLWMPEVPARVTVNEAIELAKRFADDETKRFVNGILDQVLKIDPRLEAKRAELGAERVRREAGGVKRDS